MTLGSRLRALRLREKMTQDDVARVFNISKSAVGMYERDEREPPVELLSRFAEYFGTTVDYLVGRTDNPSPLHRPIIDADIDADISELTPAEIEFLNELKHEAAWHDFLSAPVEKKRELIRVVKILMRGLSEK